MTVRWTKRLSLKLEPDALAAVGALAIRMVRERVDGQGDDARGRPLPRLEGDYARAKAAAGGRPWRGGSASGAMWRSIRAVVRGSEVRLVFTGENARHAAALQYDRRGASGPKRRVLTLLALSNSERRRLLREIILRLRLFRRGSVA